MSTLGFSFSDKGVQLGVRRRLGKTREAAAERLLGAVIILSGTALKY